MAGRAVLSPEIANAVKADRDHVWHGWSPVDSERPMIVRGDGCYIWDAAGRRYVDAVSCSMSSSCGYRHPRILATARQQLEELPHLDQSLAANLPAARLATRLADLLPRSLTRTVFANSGSEAAEAAVRISLDYWANIGAPRTHIVTFAKGYHGCTMLCRGLNDPRSPRPDPGLLLDVSTVALPAPASRVRNPEWAPVLVRAFREALEARPGQTALVLVEPLLNIAGGIVLPPGFLAGLRELCDEHGSLLGIDEVFTGFGRTGSMFGFEHEAVVPDLVMMSKGLASGYAPLSAVTVGEQIHAAFKADPFFGGLAYGHTTSGHAASCAIAAEVLDVIRDEALVENAAVQGRRLLEGLAECLKHDAVVDVRGQGLAAFIEFREHTTAEKAAERAAEEGVLVRRQASIVQLLPPLVANSDIVDAVSTAMARALAADRPTGRGGSIPRTAQVSSRTREGPPQASPIALAWRVEGPLDVERFIDALRQVVDRHDALHKPPHGSADRCAVRLDLRFTPAPERNDDPLTDQERLRAAVRAVSEQGLDLEQGPLVRLIVLGTRAAPRVVVVLTDHLVFDGISARILASELAAAYTGKPLPPLVAGYANFARRQQELLAGSYGVRARAYWRTELERWGGYPPRFHLAASLTGAQAASSLRIARRLPEDLANALEAKTAELGVSAFTVVAYALLSTTRRMGYAAKGLVTDFHGRITAAAMHTIGLFSHGMPVFYDPELQPDRDRAVLEVHERLAQAIDHAIPLRMLSAEHRRQSELPEHEVEAFMYFADSRGWTKDLILGDALLEQLRPYGPHDLRPGKGADMLSVQLEDYDGATWLTTQASPTVNPASRLELFLDACLEELRCLSV